MVQEAKKQREAGGKGEAMIMGPFDWILCPQEIAVHVLSISDTKKYMTESCPPDAMF